MNKAQHNFRLLQEIEENRRFLLQIYAQNPELLKTADARIKPLLAPLPIEKSAVSTRQCGISLIELIMFIVIVSVALAGILLVMNTVTRGSADPVIHKQALAIAESLLEEIELQDFISQDGTTHNCVTPGVAPCVTSANRATNYYVIMDYNGFSMPSPPGIYSINSTTPVSGVSGYSASAVVQATTAAWQGIPAGSAVVITVTVQAPSGEPIQSVGYRTAY